VDGKFVQRPEFNWKNPGFPQTDDHPVTCITYFDALAFLDWVSQKSKHTLRLPSEAEWEYACRAGTKEAFYWGENSKNAAEHAWFKENSRTGTQPVGTKPANPWGLHDMTGNVYQWCLDWYAPYDASLLENPIQQRSDLSDKPRRVLRGGAFHRDVKHLRSSARYRNDPRSRNADNGFRVVMELETAASKTSQSIIPPASLPVPTAAPRTAVVNTPTIQNEPALPVEVTPVNEHIPVRTVSSNSLPLGLMCCLLSGLLVIGAPLLLFLWLRSGKQDQYETTIRSLDRNEQGDAIPILPMKSADSPFQSSRDNRIRMGVDGFWILIKDLAQGTRLEYRYDAANVAHFDQLRVEPGPPEVFVYTGDTPTNCEITNLLPPESEPLLRDTFPDILPIPTATPPRSRPSEKQPLDRTSGGTFDGYPSAY
jgi:hypothetical protein